MGYLLQSGAPLYKSPVTPLLLLVAHAICASWWRGLLNIITGAGLAYVECKTKLIRFFFFLQKSHKPKGPGLLQVLQFCLRYYLNYLSEYLVELLVPLTFTLYLALLTAKALQPSCHPELLCILVSFAVALFTAFYLQLTQDIYFGLWQFIFFTVYPPLYICLTWPVEGKLFLAVLIGPADLRPLYLISM